MLRRKREQNSDFRVITVNLTCVKKIISTKKKEIESLRNKPLFKVKILYLIR